MSDPNVLRSRIFGSVDDTLEQIALIQQLIADISADATSADGLIKISVNASGVIVATRILPQALRTMEASDLASAITETTQRAAAAAAQQVDELSRRLAPYDASSPDHLDDPTLAAAERWAKLTRFPDLSTAAGSSPNTDTDTDEDFPERRSYMMRP